MDFDSPDANAIIVDVLSVRQAEVMIGSCEACRPDDAEIPFEWILYHVKAIPEETTNYLLEAPAKCPVCNADVIENTLVECRLPD